MTSATFWTRLSRRNGAFLAALLALMIAAPVVGRALGDSPGSSVAPRPARRVVAVYFHRTVRCPTCQKVGGTIDEAIKTGLASELREGRLEWRMKDFQDPKNQPYVSAFRITGPTLILMDVRGDKVVAWKPAPRCWTLLGDRPAFFAYVQGEIRSLLTSAQAGAPTVGVR
jgi:hypothetical protein